MVIRLVLICLMPLCWHFMLLQTALELDFIELDLSEGK